MTNHQNNDDKNKLGNVTFYRIISYFMWKLLTSLVLMLFLNQISKFFFVYFLLPNRENFHITTFTYVKFFFISMLIDYVKLIVFQNNEGYTDKYEQLVKLVLDPKQNTFFFFINTILLIISVHMLFPSLTPLYTIEG